MCLLGNCFCKFLKGSLRYKEKMIFSFCSINRLIIFFKYYCLHLIVILCIVYRMSFTESLYPNPQGHNSINSLPKITGERTFVLGPITRLCKEKASHPVSRLKHKANRNPSFTKDLITNATVHFKCLNNFEKMMSSMEDPVHRLIFVNKR